jgi:hypothetical protein
MSKLTPEERHAKAAAKQAAKKAKAAAKQAAKKAKEAAKKAKEAAKKAKEAAKQAAKKAKAAAKQAAKKAKEAAKQAAKKAKAAAKQAAKKAKAAKQRKENFPKTRKRMEDKLCRELRYYMKEADKAIYKHPGAEQQVAWTETKCCSKCGQTKSLMVFKRNDCGGGNIIRGDGRRNRRPDCRVCYDRDMQGKNKAKACAKRLGIAYKAPEDKRCRLCNKAGTKSNPLVFDHHHDLDVFRGYCCNRCNIGMGQLGDNVTSVAGVLKYMNEVEGLSKEQIMAMLFD